MVLSPDLGGDVVKHALEELVLKRQWKVSRSGNVVCILGNIWMMVDNLVAVVVSVVAVVGEVVFVVVLVILVQVVVVVALVVVVVVHYVVVVVMVVWNPILLNQVAVAEAPENDRNLDCYIASFQTQKEEVERSLRWWLLLMWLRHVVECAEHEVATTNTNNNQR